MSNPLSPWQRIQAIAAFAFLGASLAYGLYRLADVELPPVFPILFVLIIATLSGVAGSVLSTSTSTWSPLQSQQVKEICQHLTPEEHQALLQQARQVGGRVGKWLSITMLTSFFLMIAVGSPVGIFLVPLSAIPIMVTVVLRLRRAQAEFLCSTTWARSQGYTPETLPLTSFTKTDSTQP